MTDLTEQAFTIADQTMWELARSHCQMIGGRMYFVGDYPFPERALATASAPLKEAYVWLSDRGYVELAKDADGEYMRVLRALDSKAHYSDTSNER